MKPDPKPTRESRQLGGERRYDRLEEERSVEHQDPDDVILTMFQQASRASIRTLRKINPNNGRGIGSDEDDTDTRIELRRQDLDFLKETRQLAQAAAKVLEHRSNEAGAGELFAEMEARLATPGLLEGISPYHCSSCGGAQ